MVYLTGQRLTPYIHLRISIGRPEGEVAVPTKLHLGTSGWSYPRWRGLFYPPDLSSSDWLEFYARHFATVEINMTFYRFPRPKTLKGWLEGTPPGFCFTLKANREITHLKKLLKVKSEVRYFYILADSLREKLGCILFQLPPSIKLDLELLEEFLATLSPEHRNVIEFRDPSWYDEKAFDLLREHRTTFCVVSSGKVPKTPVETADAAYFRFHGLTGGHRYDYSDDELAEWAGVIKRVKASECYVYFNNDYQAFAVKNCLRLAELLGEEKP
jgi:uncharacterized protein YecE (DUF72 family)